MDARRKLKAKRKLACTGRSGRVEERFRALVEQGNYYEAHQTMRALYQRFLAQGKKDKAIRLLRQASVVLLEKRQWESGTEVAVTFVRLLQESKEKVTKELLSFIDDLFSCYKFFKEDLLVPHPQLSDLRMYPSLSDLSKEELSQLTSMQCNREIFMKAALKWTTVDELYKRGHPDLHWNLAKAYFSEGELLKSRYHLLYAKRPKALGTVLVEVSTRKGYPSESDLFITQAILQLLVLDNKEEAYEVFQHYCRTHPIISPDSPPPFIRRPLLNFTWFMLHTFDIGDVKLFDFLRKCYTPVINRDQTYLRYLNKIRSTYFRGSEAPPHPGLQSSGSSGLFDALLRGFSMDEDGGAGTNPAHPLSSLGPMGASMTNVLSSLNNIIPDNLFSSADMGGFHISGGGFGPLQFDSSMHTVPTATTSEELD